VQAAIGDMLVVRGHRAGEPDRTGQIIEVHAADGAPPFTIRWDDDGHVGLVFPGPDAVVHKAGATGGHDPALRRPRGATPARGRSKAGPH